MVNWGIHKVCSEVSSDWGMSIGDELGQDVCDKVGIVYEIGSDNGMRSSQNIDTYTSCNVEYYACA